MSGISSLEDISYRKKEVKESRNGSIQTTKTIIFKHEANLGDLSIDTTALVPPSDALANGFVQDNPSQLNLLTIKKNLKIHSSRGVWLQMYEDFVVSSASTIQLIGNYETLGGAEDGEVFTIYGTPVLANSVITTDHKKQWQEYILLDGQTTLNLGREFEIRNVATSQLGSIRVWRAGYDTVLLRNTANATASPSADGDFEEVDAGNGFGSTLEFNLPANGQDERVIVEFGLEYAGDFSMVGDIQALYGAILKLANDVKELGPYPLSRYLTANPSEVERRTFGDKLLSLLSAQVTVKTAWAQFTPVFTNLGAVTVFDFWQRRNGRFLEMFGTFTGVGGVAAEARIDFPVAELPDTNLVAVERGVGIWFRNNGGAAATGKGGPVFASPGLGYITFSDSNVFSGTNANYKNKAQGSTIGGVGDQVEIQLIRIPISGWTETQTLAEQLGL